MDWGGGITLLNFKYETMLLNVQLISMYINTCSTPSQVLSPADLSMGWIRYPDKCEVPNARMIKYQRCSETPKRKSPCSSDTFLLSYYQHLRSWLLAKTGGTLPTESSILVEWCKSNEGEKMEASNTKRSDSSLVDCETMLLCRWTNVPKEHAASICVATVSAVCMWTGYICKMIQTVVTQKQWKWRGENSTVWSNSNSEYIIRQAMYI